jgi:hypothetical protein
MLVEQAAPSFSSSSSSSTAPREDLSMADTVPLVIGAGPLGTFAGQIRELSIYRGALTAAQIHSMAAKL